ncbi:MAG: gliding motility protein GldL [Bacteroidales bacterium]|nr:gliding motility protein GldL [Bacteroidales bacterium]
MEQTKSKFDFINFAYGLGAAVILIAAMFKFLGWSYANEIFIVGLGTEAIVFLISAFQWKIISAGYKWENLFPQLVNDTVDENSKINIREGFNDYYKNTEAVTRSVEDLEKSIKNLASVSDGLAESVKKISTQMSKLEKSSQNYEDELTHLKSRLSNANSYYTDLLDLVEDKK